MLNTEKRTQSVIRPLDLGESSQRVEEKVLQAQAAMRSDAARDTAQTVRRTLQNYYESLRSWKLHHDFDLWKQAEAYLDQIWYNLRNVLRLAMECGLYEEVKAVFLEARHLLQKAGFVKDRIRLAAWLRAEAERRDDWATRHLMISSLAWSYTSCGYYQDLDKANMLWNELTPFLLQMGAPTDRNEYRDYLRDRQDVYPYNELLIDLYETGARIAVRCARFEEARDYIEKGKAEVAAVASSGLLSARLKERFDIAFCYHEGVAYYLSGQYTSAQIVFDDVIERGLLIAWTRLVQGAKSWLATIAVDLEDYHLCESLLRELIDKHSPITGKRDAICHLIKAQLSGKLGEDVARVESEKQAETVLKNFAKEQESDQRYRCALNALRLQPKLCTV